MLISTNLLAPICKQAKSLYLIIDILQYLYYHCLRLAHIPEPWRHIKVIFIPKAGKRSYHDAKSFRPISLSSYFLKGLERLIDWHIRSDCLVKQPINCSQHTYLTSKSTDTALNNLVTKVEKARLKNLHVLCCFIDIQGAFDHTSPLVVRRALQRHGVSTPITQWIYNMLKCRFIQWMSSRWCYFTYSLESCCKWTSWNTDFYRYLGTRLCWWHSCVYHWQRDPNCQWANAKCSIKDWELVS